jgi:branched-chain amino acid transport system ATP-binding protein
VDVAPLLRVEDLSAAYGPVTALRGVSLQVREGEIVAVLGPNGAGKSTLLRTIAGVLAPSRGRIVHRGDDIGGLRPEEVVRRGISLVPEGRQVFADLTVEENLAIGAVTRRDRGQTERDLDDVLSMFPILRTRRTQAAGSLSGGEQQQLAIGRSLMSSPRLMLLDEPSLGLAPIVVDRVFELIVGLHERGVTLLIVEQNVHRALEIADRGYVLSNGTVALEGSGERLRAREAGLEAAYLGLGEQRDG